MIPIAAGAQSGGSWKLVRPGEPLTTGGAIATSCVLVSPLHLSAGEGGDPKYGVLFLVLTPASELFLDGARILVYFRSVSEVVVFAGADSQRIGAQRPVSAPAFVEKMSSPGVSHVTVYVRFPGGMSDKLIFRTAGLRSARSRLKNCAPPGSPATGAPMGAPKVGGRGPIFSFNAFLKSDVAQKHGVVKGKGWSLLDGSFNNTLEVPREPQMSFELSTVGDAVVGFGFTFEGSRHPDVDQMALMNETLRYASTSLGSGPAPTVTSGDFATAYPQIDRAPAKRRGHLLMRTGTVGGDATLDVKVRP